MNSSSPTPLRTRIAGRLPTSRRRRHAKIRAAFELGYRAGRADEATRSA